MTAGFRKYVELLDHLLWRRALLGQLSDEEEEHIAEQLHDCRREMTPDEESQIGAIVAQRNSAANKPPLDLVDRDPQNPMSGRGDRLRGKAA